MFRSSQCSLWVSFIYQKERKLHKRVTLWSLYENAHTSLRKSAPQYQITIWRQWAKCLKNKTDSIQRNIITNMVTKVKNFTSWHACEYIWHVQDQIKYYIIIKHFLTYKYKAKSVKGKRLRPSRKYFQLLIITKCEQASWPICFKYKNKQCVE